MDNQFWCRCNVPIVERKKSSAGSDGVCWSCSVCKTTKSIRYGSFFTKSKIYLRQWMLAIVFWPKEYPVIDMAMECDLTIQADRNPGVPVATRSMSNKTLVNNNHARRHWTNSADR